MRFELHPTTRQQLEWVVSRPGGSVLLHGRQKGKKAAAIEVARRLNCLGCDDFSCTSCRMAIAGNHPDIIVLEPNEKGRITIEQIHQLHHQLTYSEYSSTSHRVVIVEDAHLLTLPAENAFLKTLEEPPAATTIILTAPSPSSLLETTVSRCRLVYMAPQTNTIQSGDAEMTDLAERLLTSPDLLGRFQAAAEAAKLGMGFTDQLVERVRQRSKTQAHTAVNLLAAERLLRRLASNVAPKTAYEAFAVELVC